MTDKPVTVPAKIKAERERLGLNRTEFAALVGVPQPYISKWELGRQGVSLDNAALLSAATGKPADYFAPRRRGRARRASIDGLVQKFSDEDWQLVHDFVTRLRTKGAGQSSAPATARSAKGKPPRGPSSGSAPAA